MNETRTKTRRATWLLPLLLVACTDREAPAPAADPAPTKATPDAAKAAPEAKTPAAPGTPISVKGRKGGGLKAPPPAAGLGPEGPSTVRSTSAPIFLKNHKSQKVALEKRIADKPEDTAAQALLAAWHETQMQLDGDLSHATAALKLLDQAIARHDTAKLRAQRAGVKKHLHDFAGAAADLEAALAKKPKQPARMRRALGEALQALGKHAEAKPHLEAAGATRPSWSDHAQQAIDHFLAGRIDEADTALRRAHAAYTDVHPIPLAWIDLQRGLLRLRTGKHDEAERFFRAAYDRLPEYYVVAEHLAEVQTLRGQHAEALKLYDAVVESTGLPEFITARAGVKEALGDAAGAKQDLDAADAAWKKLLNQHGVALAGHAVDFWLEERPDPKRAREWADKNLEVRRDPDSLLLAARARAAANDLDAARALVPDIEAHTHLTDEFQAGLAELYGKLGETEKAAKAKAEAKRLNPTVE